MATVNVIERYRGDTVADEFTIVDENGTAVDITGFSFKLTVNSLKNPPDDTTQLYSLTGVITNASGGVVEFAPSSIQANQSPGKYFYDVQMTDAGGKLKTIEKGVYKYLQDITKT